MTNNISGKKIGFIINIVYITIILLIVYIALRYAFPIFLPFIIALAVSYLAEPAIGFISNDLKIKRSIASVICITFLSLILLGVIILLSVTVLTKLHRLYDNIPLYIEEITTYFDNLRLKNDYDIITPFEQITLRGFEYIKNIDIVALLSGSFGSLAISSFSEIMMSIPYMLMSIVITFVSAVFISSSFCDIKEFILMQFNDRNKQMIFETKHSIERIFKKYVKSYAALMLITFTELTVFFMIFKIKPAATIALVISAVDILPVLGVGTVMIPWAIICFVGGNITKGLVLISIYTVITVVRQIIEPKIIGSNIGLHPIVTLISIYVGLKLLGILGMFIIPILIMIVRDLQKKGYAHFWKEKSC